MTREDFEDLVRQTVDELPDPFLDKLDHVSIEVRDWPSRADRRSGRLAGRAPLGFWQGVSELHRSVGTPFELPPRIVIYQGPHEEMARDEAHLRQEVRKTVLHEIGHFFGMTEEQLRDLGYG